MQNELKYYKEQNFEEIKHINENGITLYPLNPNNQDNYFPTSYNRKEIEELPVKIVGIAREKRTKL